MIALFICREMTCTLTVAACGRRHEIARLHKASRSLSPTCSACPVGAAHASGALPASWPDGAAIDRDVSITSAASVPMPPVNRKRKRSWKVAV